MSRFFPISIIATLASNNL
jgi:predicted acylesterase/phospholipase RssA